MRTLVRSAPPVAARTDVALVLASALALAGWGATYASLTHPGLAAGTPLAHAVGVAAQLVMSLIEAAVLVTLAGAGRSRLPYGRTVAALLVCSLAQAAVVLLQALAWSEPQVRAWLAPLAGAGVHWPPGVPRDGFALAWGQSGLLTLLRIAATAEWLHMHRALRRRAWLTVSACYVAVRLLAWWSADLLRGASPLG